MSAQKTTAVITFVGVVAIGVAVLAAVVFRPTTEYSDLDYTPDEEMIALADEVVKMDIRPAFPYSFDYMTEGAQQHLDRDYTYDVIPWQLKGGLLFQGVHRPPAGTSIQMEMLQPVTVYFFFHHKTDGGYTKIFEELPQWERMDTAPQYDIRNGDHGLHMTMFKLEAQAGIIEIPRTRKDRACFSIVFQSPFGKLAEPDS
jgi:hypothetical protein